jgi:hypothetical protein
MSDMSTTSDMISIKEPSSHSATNLRDPVQIPMLEVAVWNYMLLLLAAKFLSLLKAVSKIEIGFSFAKQITKFRNRFGSLSEDQ